MARAAKWLINNKQVSIFRRKLKEGNVLFNDALNTFYLQLHGVRHIVNFNTDSDRGNPLPPHRLLPPISSKGFLYASSHRQDNTYHGLCCTSRRALAGTTNSLMRPPRRIDPNTHRTMSERSFYGATSRSQVGGGRDSILTILTKTVVCAICGMVHIKEPLLLIRKSNPYGGFLSDAI